MCIPGLDPITLALLAASTAASVGGGMINANIQNDAIQRQNEENRRAAEAANFAADQERMRQRAYEEQQVAEVAEALTKANPAKALVKATRRAEKSPVATDTGKYNATPTPPVQNKSIEADAKKTGAKKAATTDKITEALAMLTAMGSEFGSISDAIGRSGSNIATIGSNRRGSMNASELETRPAAASVTPSDSILGDILLLGGQAGAGLAGRRIDDFDIGSIFRRRPVNTANLPQNLHGLY